MLSLDFQALSLPSARTNCSVTLRGQRSCYNLYAWRERAWKSRLLMLLHNVKYITVSMQRVSPGTVCVMYISYNWNIK